MKRKKSQKNKEVFFLAGLPRSGNTILSSILNQNPDVCCTPNSITLEIYKDLFLLKPGTATRKPTISEIKIDVRETLIVSQNPLIKKFKLSNPCSKVGSNMYHPQL